MTTMTTPDLDLESLLNDEAKCELRHADPQNRVCSGDVVSIYSRKCELNYLRLACSAGTAYIESCRNDEFSVCVVCKSSCRECWATRPV